MNKQYFSKEQIKKGKLNKLLLFLLEQSWDKDSDYENSIVIEPYPYDDEVCVKWENVYKKSDTFNRWEFINGDEEELVAKYYTFLDGQSVLLPNEEGHLGAATIKYVE